MPDDDVCENAAKDSSRQGLPDDQFPLFYNGAGYELTVAVDCPMFFFKYDSHLFSY